MMEKLYRTVMVLCIFFLIGCATVTERQAVHLGVVDHITDGIVSMLVGLEETYIYMPLKLMPVGTAEGDWVEVKLSYDPIITHTRRKRIDTMLEAISCSSK